MFSPATKRLGARTRRDHDAAHHSLGFPTTPQPSSAIHNRPSTGTPAPWAPSLSTLARIPLLNRPENSKENDFSKPVYVSEFPQVVRDEQTKFFHNNAPGYGHFSGGMDQETCLSWVVLGSKAFIWSYLPSASSKKQNCVILDLPCSTSQDRLDCSWMVSFLNWDAGEVSMIRSRVPSSVGIIFCNRKTRSFFFCPDIYGEITFVTASVYTDAGISGGRISSRTKRKSPQKHLIRNCDGVDEFSVVSMVAFPVDNLRKCCLAVACISNGELWQLYCSAEKIQQSKIGDNLVSLSLHNQLANQYYPRSLICRYKAGSVGETSREFFLLTDSSLHCFKVQFQPEISVSKSWSYDIVGIESGLGISEDSAGNNRLCPLDMQVDDGGAVIIILIATIYDDWKNTPTYAKYSLFTLQFKSTSGPNNGNEKLLEKKIPVQDLVCKTLVEDHESLFSMRLRVGGKPNGSVTILSGDGTATVSHYNKNAFRLYQFDLPYGAGNVLDASILPSVDDSESGAWVVLTEKAGVWAIPEEAILIGGVEKYEMSLYKKTSANKVSAVDLDRYATKGTLCDESHASESKRALVNESAPDSVLDEESEVLIGQLFHNFCSTGLVDSSFQKLQNTGSFEKSGELNVFTKMSKSIVDTFAKHWTTTRGAEIMASAIVSSQLHEKKQKHEKYLQFLALTKCHEELCSKQRKVMLTILEHGEKLFAMIQLREMQGTLGQNSSNESVSPQHVLDSQNSGAFWDLIQLVGDISRRKNTVLLDRDNAEIFYTKVSHLEQVFDCLDKYFKCLINEDQPYELQVRRACDMSTVLITVFRASIQYKNEHQIWYPAIEGLTPWYCDSVVRNGFWRVGSFMRQAINEASGVNDSLRSTLYACLELLTEVFLETYTGAITGKLDRGEDLKGLREEYWNRRNSLLEFLYEQVRYFVEGRHQIFNISTDEAPEETFKKLASNLLSIARRHEDYNTMWKIVSNLNDLGLLRRLMRESMGPRGGFSYYVFKQLYEKKRFSMVLRFGEEFQEELLSFLKDHKDLLWLHELFLRRLPSASETLHSLALAQAGSEIDECVPNHSALIRTLSDRKRLLNLSKISALAGRNGDYKEVLKRIEADTKILELQEAVNEVMGAGAPAQKEGRLLLPEDLISICIDGQSREMSLWAFDVLAWTSSSFRMAHANLLEECWRNAADQDDWLRIHHASVDEAWTDHQTLQHLRNTVLFLASARCYGHHAVDTYDGHFSDVLPLTAGDQLTPSVESILMQHKDFPDAGKLMKAAIVLGSVS